ncbi:hypothetical protein Ahia01_000756900 [Argonauta hians]
MDVRHRWIAEKIQQTFNGDKIFSLQVLKSFLYEEKVLAEINKFFAVNSPKCLFVYRSGQASEVSLALSTETLTFHTKAVDKKDFIFLYFLRKDITNVIDDASIYKEILCGEIKGDPFKIFSEKLSEIYLPFLNIDLTRRNCSMEKQKVILQNIEKCTEVLSEFASSRKYFPVVMSQAPGDEVCVPTFSNDFYSFSTLVMGPARFPVYVKTSRK